MPLFLDTRGRSTLGIGICDRCRMKMSLDCLHPDRNLPGLRVCDDCNDEYDPYRYAAPPVENISLPFVRPDAGLATTAGAGINVGDAVLGNDGEPFILDESRLG